MLNPINGHRRHKAVLKRAVMRDVVTNNAQNQGIPSDRVVREQAARPPRTAIKRNPAARYLNSVENPGNQPHRSDRCAASEEWLLGQRFQLSQVSSGDRKSHV